MAHTLPRQFGYEDSYSYNILARIPVVIKLDGRSFARVSKNTPKPFCQKTMALLNKTMLSLVKQIDGVVFGYQYSDKIFLVLRNDRSIDEDPWFGNDIQKLASVSASMCTYEFMTQMWSLGEEAPSLEGSITFASQAFGLPSIKETVNYFIHRQLRCMHHAVNEAVYSVLLPKYGRQTPTILEEKNLEQRRQILDEAGFEFESLPGAFRRGSAAYLAPALAQTSQGQRTRQKWLLDFDIPLLAESKEWLGTIITTGSDIFRPERDYNESIRGTH